MESNTEALDVADVCALYKVHPNTVRTMAKDGRLKHGRVGRDFRFSRQECDRVFLGIGAEKPLADEPAAA